MFDIGNFVSWSLVLGDRAISEMRKFIQTMYVYLWTCQSRQRKVHEALTLHKELQPAQKAGNRSGLPQGEGVSWLSSAWRIYIQVNFCGLNSLYLGIHISMG